MKNPDVAKKVSKSKKGRHLLEEHKRKISECEKGRILSEETKEKMSIASKNRQMDSKGHFIKINK